jgi:hypothetical protein
MHESIQKLVRPTSRRSVRLQTHVLTFLVALTIQSHEIWNLLGKQYERKSVQATLKQPRFENPPYI